MTWTRRIIVVMAVLGIALCANAFAQEEKGEKEHESDAAVAELRAELAAIKKELRGIRDELRQLRGELKKAQTAKTPPKKRQADTTVYNIDVGSSPIRGPADAKVTIVEFVDLQCPFCAREWPKIKQISEQYPNDVRVVFKHFPLSFHKKAPGAHAAMVFAYQGGGADVFWKMHDKIVAKPKDLDIKHLRVYAEELEMDLAKFDTFMDDPGTFNALFVTDQKEARKCKVRGTPSVFINGLRLADRSLNGYKTRIDAILAGEDKPAEEKEAAGAAGQPIKIEPGKTIRIGPPAKKPTDEK